MKSVSSAYDHPRLGGIDLVRSARASRITLTVKPSGAIRLTYPYGCARSRALAFLESRIAWAEAARERMARRQAALPSLPPERQQELIEQLRSAAKTDLPARTASIAARLGMSYGRVTVRASRSKWGSCSPDNNLSLSLFLMNLPEHLRDYVIVHELCHTVHKNHSRDFHRLVDRLVGGREKELQRELRGYTTRLP